MYVLTGGRPGLGLGQYRSSRSYFGEPNPVSTVECGRYETGEIEKSHCQTGPCQNGHLVADVIRHPRGLLIADFGVGWSGIKAATKKEKLLQDWMSERRPDLLSIKLRIYGYSDCVGAEKDNKELRRRRAEQVYGLLDEDLQKRVEFAMSAAPGEYVVDNKTREGRANNRGVIIELIRLPKEVTCIGPGCPPPPPIPCTGPGCQHPPPPPPCTGPGCKPAPPQPPCTDPNCKPTPPKPIRDPALPKPPEPIWRWHPPTVREVEPSDSGGKSWVWKSIEMAATALGITITIGLRSVSLFEAETALEAAWLAFQIETGGLKIAVGNAGEAAARAFIGRALGMETPQRSST